MAGSQKTRLGPLNKSAAFVHLKDEEKAYEGINASKTPDGSMKDIGDYIYGHRRYIGDGTSN